ncbi:class I SAM-dependent methyltransferase [Oryzomicrobium sp.]|uniref:class I SAM-dependent methyltransferase n=1 Tax=Oryzomicrobium sp. TaxID=1911578 RepID=UPI002FE06DE3
MKHHLRKLLKRFPRLKRAAQRLLSARGVSTDYQELADEGRTAELERLGPAWKSEILPARQRELVERELTAYLQGAAVPVFDVLVRSLRDLDDTGEPLRVLEVGCSSGYYSEVFAIAGLVVEYAGCDYSEAFVAMARARYPGLNFAVEDATALGYPDGAYDVVISGCCLLHIPAYPLAVAETARVARRYAIFHRTPVVIGRPDMYYRKKAYGVETVEIHFNEAGFLALLAASGLELIATHTLDETLVDGRGHATRSYVCRKKVA